MNGLHDDIEGHMKDPINEEKKRVLLLRCIPIHGYVKIVLVHLCGFMDLKNYISYLIKHVKLSI